MSENPRLLRRYVVLGLMVAIGAISSTGCDGVRPFFDGRLTLGESSVLVNGETDRVGTGPLRTYAVEVEPATGLDALAVSAEIESIVADPRGWTAEGEVSFARVDVDPSFRILVATPDTVDRLCRPLRTGGYLSCQRGPTVLLNADRWRFATDFWPTEPGIAGYRAYLVNHEIGHILGQPHRSCPGPGRLAPIMAQQTKGLDGCRANGWPHPVS